MANEAYTMPVKGYSAPDIEPDSNSNGKGYLMLECPDDGMKTWTPADFNDSELTRMIRAFMAQFSPDDEDEFLDMFVNFAMEDTAMAGMMPAGTFDLESYYCLWQESDGTCKWERYEDQHAAWVKYDQERRLNHFTRWWNIDHMEML